MKAASDSSTTTTHGRLDRARQRTRASCRPSCYQGPRRQPSLTSFGRHSRIVGRRTTCCLATRRLRRSKARSSECHSRLGTIHERTCVVSRSKSDWEVHGLEEVSWCPTSTDAPDLHGSHSAHNGLRCVDVACTFTHRSQKACRCARTGAAMQVNVVARCSPVLRGR